MPDNHNLKAFTIIQFLNNGSFGKAVVATKQDVPEKRFVLKIIPLDVYQTHATEIEILKDLRGVPGVVQYIENFATTTDMVIVMEYHPGEELFQYIVEHGPFEPEVAKDLFRQLCEIMMTVHSKGIVHRDLKPENIIIHNSRLTIIDWGLAFYPSNTTERQSCGSPNYASPELIITPVKYDGPEVDVWSMGVILYSLHTATLPFNSDTIVTLFNCIRYCKVNYNRKDLPDNVANLLRTIFVRTDRPTVSDILNDGYFTRLITDVLVRHPQKTDSQGLFEGK